MRPAINVAQSRRRFIGALLSTPFVNLRCALPLGMGFLAAPNSSRAQEPGTVAAVAQTAQMAIGFASLFGQGGPGIADLLNLQTQMLGQISAQIGIVQTTLNLIFQSVQELKTLLIHLPESTVVELYRAKIIGSLNEYTEIMRLYNTDTQAHGLAAAQNNSGPRLNELLTDLRRSRDVLFGYKDEMTVPVVCAALLTETHAMIMDNYRVEDAKNMLESYKSLFFAPLMNSADPKSVQAMFNSVQGGMIKAFQSEDSQVSTYAASHCYTDVHVGAQPIVATSAVLHEVSVDPRAPTADIEVDIQRALSELKKNGANILPEAITWQARDAHVVSITENGKPIPVPSLQGEIAKAGLCTDPPLRKLPAETASDFMRKVSGPTDLLRLQYVTYSSINLCGSSALAFIDRMSKSWTTPAATYTPSSSAAAPGFV